MRSDNLDGQPFAQLVCPASMVDVTMGQPDFLQRQAVFMHDLQDGFHISAGIDDNPFLRILIEQNGAVLLEGGDGNDPRLQHTHENLFNARGSRGYSHESSSTKTYMGRISRGKDHAGV